MLSKSKIKYIQSLGHKKFRDAEAVFIAEGPKIVDELLREQRLTPVAVYATTAWQEMQGALPAGLVTTVSAEELQRISQLQTANQVLGIFQKPECPAQVITGDKIILMLDSIQDPGNLGTIIRIADWFGIEQVICSQETADLYNPKVIQSTMASIARVHTWYTDLRQWMAEHPGCRYFAATLEGRTLNTMEPLQEGVIMIGNESRGLQAALVQQANVKITIPRVGQAESLNAAVATGIILSRLAVR